jgi:hypothetical protein
VDSAYKALFAQHRVGGLNTPAAAREFLRSVTLSHTGRTPLNAAQSETGPAWLNATHFYLASLLSLQHRGREEKGVDWPVSR